MTLSKPCRFCNMLCSNRLCNVDNRLHRHSKLHKRNSRYLLCNPLLQLLHMCHITHSHWQNSHPCFYGRDNEDVILWARCFQKIATLPRWAEDEAIALAELHLCSQAQQWFVGLDSTQFATFTDLYNLLVNQRCAICR